MKENDWIVATLNNPEFTAADFKNIQGLSLDNTQLLSKDEYLKTPFVTENKAFKNEDGTFNKDKFEVFYNNQAKKFSDFQQENTLDNYTYGFWDTARKPNSKVMDPKIGVEVTLNPEHISTGVIGQGMSGERQYSDMELAQMQKIKDFNTNQDLDYSANDAALFSNPIRFIKDMFNPFKDSLVLATYDQDEDSINPITGQMEHHKKGDKKLNGAGEYYLETLGGRSVIGKNVLSLGDIITSDTSALNKYDFFDSDGLDKDPIGVITKNLIAVAPMALLGPVGTSIYGGIYVARELAKAMPMLYQISTSLFGNTSDSKLLNSMSAIGSKFTSGTSDYAKQHTFSFENFGNLVSDVALQWGQQKAIADAITRLRNSSKNIIDAAKGKAMKEFESQANNLLKEVKTEQATPEVINNLISYIGIGPQASTIKQVVNSGLWENTVLGQAALKKFMPEAKKAYANRVKLGQDLSLLYMAIVSNTDVYQDAIEHGATKREAATVALGSTVGMFMVDKYAGLGEMFFDDPDAIARREFKQVLGDEASKLRSSFGKIANTTQRDEKQSYLDIFRGGLRAGREAVKKYNEKIKDRSLGILEKSIGEGLEEVSEELVTDLIKSLYEISSVFGYSPATDSLGAWENSSDRYLMSFFGGAVGGGLFGGIEAFKKPRSATDKNTQKELLYLIKEGKTQDVLKQLDVLHDKGQLGSKEISIDTTGEIDNKTFLTADQNHKSQNDFVYDIMKSSILQMESIINGNQLNLSDDQLFERMVLSDPKYMALKDVLQEKSYITSYYNRYENLIQDVYNNEREIKSLEDSTPDPQKRNTQEFQDQMNKLLQKKQELQQEIENFKAGKYAYEYVDRTLFAMNPEISGQFLSMAFDQWVKTNKERSISELNENELNQYKQEWDNYNKTNRKLDFEQAYQLYKETAKKINPVIQELAETSNVKSWQQISNKLIETFPINFLKQSKDIDDEELGNIEGLTSEEIQAKREEIANQYNNENFARFIQQFAENNSIIDASTYRKLFGNITKRRRDIVSEKIILNKRLIDNLDEEFSKKYKEVLNTLNEDLSNVEDVKNKIIELQRNYQQRNLYKDVPIGFGLSELTQDYYTIQDILSILDSQRNGKEISEDDLDEIFGGILSINPELSDDIVTLHNLELNKTLENETKRRELLDKIENNSYSDDNIEKAILISENKYTKDLESTVQQNIKDFEEALNETLDSIKSDPYYKGLTDVKKKLTFDANPTIRIIKAIASKLGQDFSNIEDTLQSIYDQYERLDNVEDYLLSDQQIEALEKAKQLISIAKGFVTAASQQDNYFHMMPYYKTINEFTREHKGELETYEEFPELDQDTANVIKQSLNLYDKEIDLWIEHSKKNSLNKIKEFKEFDRKFYDIRLEFLKSNVKSFKFDDGTDLMEGWESLDLSKPDGLFELAKLLHANFKKSGKTAAQLIPILKNIIDFKKLSTQITSELNGSITSDTFTDYDKLTYLSTIFAADPVDFYRFYKNFIENESTIIDQEGNSKTLAPLSFQEHCIKLIYAQQQNPQFINQLMHSVAKDLKLVDFDDPGKKVRKMFVLKNASIITGLGGAGKSQVVARAFAAGENVWISGPTSTQIDNLLTLNSKAKAVNPDELIKYILEPGEYEQILSEVNSKNKKSDGKIKYEVLSKGDFALLNPNKVKFKKLKDAPEKLIIDEITLFSNIQLQLLSKWAEINNVKLLFLGDENQNGNQEAGYNISPDFTFAFRTPRLSISLRQGNYWKYINQKPLEEYLDSLRSDMDGNEREALAKQYKNSDLKNYQLHYYFENGILTGDIITPNITDELIKSLGDKKIGYVGLSTDDVYQKLKAAGKNVELNTPQEIQGKEYDYVVINKDWKFNASEGKFLQYTLQQYLQDLYTMITRSKKGSIIIDNGLTSVIGGSKQENYTTDAITLNPQSTQEFTNSKLTFLNSLDLTSRNIQTKEEQTEAPLVEINNPVVIPDTPVELGQQSNEKESDEEISESETETQEPITENPYKAFGNIGYTGLAVETRNGKEIWTKSDDSNRDLGIFLQKGQQLITSQEQREYSEYLIKLKGFIQFGGDYNRLPVVVKRLFTQEDINNMKYYVVSEPQENTHILRVQQGLNDDNSSFIKDSNNIPQVLTIQGRITKNGKTYSITLGALQSLENSKSSKNILRDQLKRNGITNIDKESQSIIDSYERELIAFVEGESKEKEINKPYFDKTTSLRKSKRYRLQDLNQEGEKSTYDLVTDGFVSSPIYTILSEDELEQLGLSTNLVGKPIMYVSANPNLLPDELASRYSQQKSDKENKTPEVRCVVLDTEGVSFESLLKNGYSQKYYSTTVSASKKFQLPFVSLPMAVRMYLGLWNFRANLINFNDAVREQFSGDTSAIDEAAKLDKVLYEEARNGKYINEQKYREWVRNNKSKEILDKVKVLWDFNDNLTVNGVREFRIGYSSEAGAYPRKINDSEIGIYINRELAEQYENAMKALFNNVIDQLIPPIIKDNITAFVDKKATKEKWEELEKGWVKNIQEGGSLDIITSKGAITYNFGSDERVRMLPTILKEINVNLLARGFVGVVDFDQELSEGHYNIKIGDQSLNYLSIQDAIGIVETRKSDDGWNPPSEFIPGTEKYDQNGGIIDKRVINMFNLAFHGITGTREFNNFEDKGQIRASDALFPNGFYVDTFISDPTDATRNTTNKIVLTNKTFYSADVVPSGPMIWFSFKSAQEQVTQPAASILTPLQEKIKTINSILGVNISESTDEEDLEEIISYKIENNKNSLFDDTIINNILDIIVDYDGQNFKTLKQWLNEKGYQVEDLQKVPGELKYQFIIEDTLYYITKDVDGKLYVNTAKPTTTNPNDIVAPSSTISTITDYVANKLGISQDDKEEFKEIFINNNNPEFKPTKNSLKNSKVIQQLLDIGIIDNPNELIKIIDSLDDATNGGCSIPII